MPDNRDSWDVAKEDYLRDKPRQPKVGGLLMAGIILVVTVVLLAAIGIAGLYFSRGRTSIQRPAVPHYSNQIVGRQLSWRSLYILGRQSDFLENIASGDFDGDGDPELMLRTARPEFFLLELDGTITQQQGFPEVYTDSMFAWDYDRDGTDELVMDDYQAGPGFCAYNMQGQTLGTLSSLRQYGFSIAGDYDGDGHDELLMHDANAMSTEVLTAFGKSIRTTVNNGTSVSQMLADIDGDGKVELLVFDGQQFEIFGEKQNVETPEWPQVIAGARPSLAADLTGDGIPELIDPLSAILDTTDKCVPLQYTTGASGGTINYSGWLACTVFNDPGLKQPLVVVIPDSRYPADLYMFDATGALVYQESRQPYAMDCYTVEYQGTEHLIIATSDEVLIYP